MSYSHYYRRPETFDKKKWKDFTKELETLAKNLPERSITASCSYKEPIIICGWNEETGEYDRAKPIICDGGETVAFDGEGKLGHESLVIERKLPEEHKKYHCPDMETGLYFSFCKTARKPYDTMVCLALISMKRWFMHKVVVSSDGDREEWQPALDLYYKLTGVIINWDMLTHNPTRKDRSAE
jgi:hypothetical protein